eukprot:CAMPEP_0172714632 /NCGR_PEP_ID=MMETSP1074-20121228/66361_1 /TAXON_ID=2916 /ORGANISM="Ceratium fusus, Strain PA161109" /LENGTH=37 /DNA_ID= /DNA_START= /DNA_END= /DNA_ORIENTATION=
MRPRENALQAFLRQSSLQWTHHVAEPTDVEDMDLIFG